MDSEDLIRKYFQEEMTNDEWAHFHSLLIQDKSFREAFKVHELLFEVKAQEIKIDILKKIKQSPQINLTKKTDNTWLKVTVGLILVLLITFIFFSFFNSKTNNFETQLRAYIEDIALPPPVLMGSSELEKTYWDVAMKSYRNENYEETISQLLLIENPTKEQTLYKGLSYMYKDNPDYDKAKFHFKNIIDSDGVTIKDEALWYYALICLTQENISEGTRHLDLIISGKSWNHEKAKKLRASIQE